MRVIAIWAALYAGAEHLIPLYALYALLFADHGLDPGQISLLLALWSATGFVFEVPSGAWADTVPRRLLLMLGALLTAAAFLLWTVAPSYPVFALGFVLWGIAGSLSSGTFEALLYDELAARDRARDYARVAGYARASGEIGAVVAIVAATPLYLWGGYALVGWVSVGFALLHAAIAGAAPAAPRTLSAREVEELGEETTPSALREPRTTVPATSDAVSAMPVDAVSSAATGSEGVFARYLRMLRTGLREALTLRVVRRGVMLLALLYGVTAVDEYFALIADEAGVATSVVPILVGLGVVGSMVGTLLAARSERASRRTVAWILGVSGVLFFGGAVLAGFAARRPELLYVLVGIGITGLAIGYGALYNAGIVAEARLQDAISGPARATVTSVSGLFEELISLIVFGYIALATQWLSMSTTIAGLGVVIVLIAVLFPTWLPAVRADEPDHTAKYEAGERT